MATKTTEKLNTFFNPLTTRTWAPEWFTPFGDENYRENKILFHAAALLATYGALGYGARKLQGLYGDDTEKQRIDKAIKSHIESQEPILNPDSDITDDEEIYLKNSPMIKPIEKKADGPKVIKSKPMFKDNTTEREDSMDGVRSAVAMGGLFIPALAAYTAYMYGNKKADEIEDKKELSKQEAVVKKLENIYQKANMERLLSAKGYTPEEIKSEEKNLINKTAGSTETDERLGELTGKADSTFMSYLRPAGMLLMLGLGGLAYGSYKIGQHYLEGQDPERKKRQAIKKALEQRLMYKQPTKLIGDFGPKLKSILDKPAKKTEVPRTVNKQEPVLESAPEEETNKNLTDLLNTV